MKSFRREIKPSFLQELEFYARSVFYISRYVLECKHPELTKKPLSGDRKKASSLARKLLSYAKKGVRLEDVRKQIEIEHLLQSLVNEMGKTHRKQPYNRAKSAERAGSLFIRRVTCDFREVFGQPLGTVTAELATVVGYQPHFRTIEHAAAEGRQPILPEVTGNAILNMMGDGRQPEKNGRK